MIDEADMILDMGFKQQITHIVKQAADIPPIGKCQTILFSATFPRNVHELIGDRENLLWSNIYEPFTKDNSQWSVYGPHDQF